MKKHNVIFVILCVMAVLVAVLVKRCPRTVPYAQCGEVYKRYSKVEGVCATYVKNYPLNDSITVAATLLEATTDSGWVRLQEDFELPIIPKEYEERFVGDSNRVSIKKFPKDVPLFLDGDTLTDDLIIVSHYKHTICHFVIHSDKQFRAIMFKHFDDNTKKAT